MNLHVTKYYKRADYENDHDDFRLQQAHLVMSRIPLEL
jgi:hypothetical protein